MKMLAISPPLFPTIYRWPFEDLITKNTQLDYNDISVEVKTNLYNSHLNFPTYDQTQHEFVPGNSISSGGDINSNIGHPMKVAKKFNHNASERDRRERVNELYTFLRSLLPMSRHQKKRVSIPGTVSHALTYIPELQNEVEALKRKKEKLLSCSSRANIMDQGHLEIRSQSATEAKIQTKSTVVSSVNILNEKEVVIQLNSSTDNVNKNKLIGFLSKALEYLEDEDELVLLNATSFKCFGELSFLNTLHLLVQGDRKIEAEKLNERLCCLYQQSHI